MANNIQFILTATDDVSPKLRNINSQLQSMSRTSGIPNMQAQMQAFGREADNAGTKFQSLGQKIKGISSTIAESLGTIAKGALLQIGMDSIQTLINTIEDLGHQSLEVGGSIGILQSRLERMGTSADGVNSVINTLRDTSNRLGIPLGDMVREFSQLSTTFQGMPVERIAELSAKISTFGKTAGIFFNLRPQSLTIGMSRLNEAIESGNVSLVKQTELWRVLPGDMKKALQSAIQSGDFDTINNALDQMTKNMVDIEDVAKRDPLLALNIAWNRLVNTIGSDPEFLKSIQRLAQLIIEFVDSGKAEEMAGILINLASAFIWLVDAITSKDPAQRMKEQMEKTNRATEDGRKIGYTLNDLGNEIYNGFIYIGQRIWDGAMWVVSQIGKAAQAIKNALDQLNALNPFGGGSSNAGYSAGDINADRRGYAMSIGDTNLFQTPAAISNSDSRSFTSYMHVTVQGGNPQDVVRALRKYNGQIFTNTQIGDLRKVLR